MNDIDFDVQSLQITAQLKALTKIEETDKVPLAGVSLSGGNPVLYINPSTWKELNETEKSFILDHEMLHLILNHHSRFNGKSAKLSNIATDLAINSFLFTAYDKKHMPFLIKEYGILDPEDSKFNLEPLRSADYYYATVRSTVEPTYSWSGYGDPMDKLDEQGWGASLQDLEDQEESVEMQQARQAGLGVGQLIDILKEELSFALSRRRFSQFLLEVSGKKQLSMVGYDRIETWSAPSRRIKHKKIRLPSDHFRVDTSKFKKNRILVFADVSGSCTAHSAWFTQALEAIPDRYFIKTIKYFDTQVHDQLRSGGGTAFEPLVAYASENEHEWDQVFVLSDGEGTPMSNCPSPHKWIWFLTPDPVLRFIPQQSQVWSLDQFVLNQGS